MAEAIEDVLLEIIGVCEQLTLEYAVMGGIAVRVHGIPRPTFDVDLELSVTEVQLREFFKHCLELGYSIAEPYQSGWRDEVGGMPLVKLRTFLREGNGVDVDIFLNETPFQNSILQRRQRLEISGKAVQVVTAEDLVLLKLLANRPRDFGDIADILFIQGQLDETYMRGWAKSLGLTQRLEQVLNDQD